MNESEWLTYAEAGRRLGISSDAARQRANRGRWAKTLGNDGKRRISYPMIGGLPYGARTTLEPPVDGRHSNG